MYVGRPFASFAAAGHGSQSGDTGAAPGGLVLKLVDGDELERRAADGDAQPGLRELLDAAGAVVVGR